MNRVNISIVLFHNDMNKVKKVILSALDTPLNVMLYLIDNSTNDDLKILTQLDDKIIYIHNSVNLGFGSAHNIALNFSINEKTPYHLVLNPDVMYDNNVLMNLYEFMELNSTVGNISPKILYPNGEIQYLSKLLPTPFILIVRRFFLKGRFLKNLNDLYQLKFTNYNILMNVPNLSGCFMFLRTSALKDVGTFDSNIFLYFEDVDLNRRIHIKYQTLFYPFVSVYHDYAKGSYLKFGMLMLHIKSSVYYFNKWGWFIDKVRRKTNKRVLQDLQTLSNPKKN